MQTKRGFDIIAACQQAWDVCWAANLESRKSDEAYAARTGKRVYNSSRTYYLCASDIENQVRAFAEDSLRGNPWRNERVYGRMYGGNVRIRGPRGQNLQATVRDWLFDQCHRGVLTYHNFGRGHISGARFRPVGQPMAPAEQETVAHHVRTKDKPRPVHYQLRQHYGSALCVAVGKRKRSPFNRSRPVRTNKDIAQVTCQRCINLHQQKKHLECKAVA